MQRAKDANRVYAYVAGVDANCDGFKEEGCSAVSMSSQIELYRDTYQHFNLNPLDVSFVEAHGYSTLVPIKNATRYDEFVDSIVYDYQFVRMETKTN